MKLTSVTALFINVCFRVFILFYMLKAKNPSRRVEWMKSLKTSLEPVSKRVILIVADGLGSGFLSQNSTPFIQDMVRNFGFAGTVKSAIFETNEAGMRTLLSGRRGYASPFFWTRPKNSETILDYVDCKCWMGKSLGLSSSCYYPEENPLLYFSKFPKFFGDNNSSSCIYIINFDMDPILVDEYHSKLRELDKGIKHLATTVDDIWNDAKTTFILTSGRGSPVGDSLSIDAPIVAWGKGIAFSNRNWRIGRSDLTAMLCMMLGISFPVDLFGIIPDDVIDILDYYRYKWIFYTIRHYERVLRVSDENNYVLSSSELQMQQLKTRLNFVIKMNQKATASRWMKCNLWLAILQMLWGFHLTSISANGCVEIGCTLNQVFTLIFIVIIAMTYFWEDWELKISTILLLWLWIKCSSQINQEIRKIGTKCFLTFILVGVAVSVVGSIGNRIVIPCLLALSVFWPLWNGSYSRLNIVVLFIRILSGIALTALPFNRKFGELPNFSIIFFTSVLFLCQFNVLFFLFKRSIDFHIKCLYLLVVVTFVHVGLIYEDSMLLAQQLVSFALLALFFFSVIFTSGTLLERFTKIFLAFFIPVQMFAIRVECIFYVLMILHMFSWVFVEYHGEYTSPFKYTPSIFWVESGKFTRPEPFSFWKILIFLTYVYLSYFAIGYFPELHSYDFYVLPQFIFRYSLVVSYFLSGIKFFIVFFVPTITFMVLSNLQQKDCEFQILTFVWTTDVVGIFLNIIYGFSSKVLAPELFPDCFYYFILQQFASICIILSYYLGSYIFLPSASSTPSPSLLPFNQLEN